MANYGSAIGAGIGGLLGGSDADSGPAGYTTSTKTEQMPGWLQGYAGELMRSGYYDAFAKLRDKGPSQLLGAGEAELLKTILGEYLHPESNPYLAAIAKNVSDITGRSIDSRFSSAGRYGSGAYADTVTSAISKSLTDLYGANYAAERGRQYNAASTSPAFVSASTDAMFSPYISFAKLFPNLRESGVTEPYFKNKGAGILGGAMAGSQLGKMFGGSGGGGGGSFADGGQGTDFGGWYGW